MASIDDIIGGSFESLGLPRLSQSEQLQWLKDYSSSNSALRAINAATPSGEMAPASWMAYQGGVPVSASMPPLPRVRPGNAPTSIDMAAINAPRISPQPVTRVTGQMKPGGSGGLLDLIFGPSKNGLPGLAGLLGGPQQGGLLQMLLGGGKHTAGLPRQAPAMTSAQKYAALNSGPGSVSAMEAKHSGRPSGAYSDGREPSGTGSLW